METRWYQFHFFLVFITDDGFHCIGHLIVQYVLLRNDARLFQAQHHGKVCSCKFRVCEVLDGLYHYGIAINFYLDHDVLVALFESGVELPGMVRKN